MFCLRRWVAKGFKGFQGFGFRVSFFHASCPHGYLPKKGGVPLKYDRNQPRGYRPFMGTHRPKVQRAKVWDVCFNPEGVAYGSPADGAFWQP